MIRTWKLSRVEPRGRLGAVGRLPHVVAVALQRLGQERAHALFVVGDQDAGHPILVAPAGNHDAELRATLGMRVER